MPERNSTRAPVRPSVSNDTITDALRDAAGWLQTAADTFGLASLRDAAARAQATLAEVSHG